MSRFNTLTNIPSRFTTPLAYRKDGSPVFLIGGGSVNSTEEIPPAPVPNADLRFTADDIQKARSEEKDKVYQRLTEEAEARKALEAQMQTLLQQQAEREKAEAEARQAAEDAARAKAESEMSAKELLAQREQEFQQRLAQTEQTFEQKFAQMQQEREQEQAMLAKDREVQMLQSYIQTKVTESQDTIAPQLLEFIGGNNQAEVDASIERVKAKSAELASAAREAFNQARSQQRGVSPTGYAPVGPLDVEGQQRQYSPQDIAQMSMEEYAKFRAQIPGMAATSTTRGLYG